MYSSCTVSGLNVYCVALGDKGGGDGVACVVSPGEFKLAVPSMYCLGRRYWVNALVDAYAPLRRSTVEVHPETSEAPHLRSSIPRPGNDLSKNQIASR